MLTLSRTLTASRLCLCVCKCCECTIIRLTYYQTFKGKPLTKLLQLMKFSATVGAVSGACTLLSCYITNDTTHTIILFRKGGHLTK